MNRDSKDLNQIALFVGKTVLVVAGYFVFGWMSSLFATSESTLPLVLPQAGFALAVVLLVGFDALLGAFLGSILISVYAGSLSILAVAAAIGNTLAACFSAYFLINKNEFDFRLQDIRSIAKLLVLGVLISPFIASTVNLLGIVVAAEPLGDNFPVIWGSGWLRSALGSLIFAPFLIIWLGNPLPKIKKENLIEGFAILVVGVGLESLIFFSRLHQEVINSLTFLLIPTIIWTSIRMNIHGLATVNVISSSFFLWGMAMQSGGLFDGENPYSPTFFMILFTMWATSLILSASIAKFNKVQKSLADLSNHDPLTGLFNRLFFDTELQRLENSRQFPISIIMSDVDNLKEINDAYGHASGDQLLKNLAKVFTSVFRREDILCRVGGDEFVALLPLTNASETGVIMQRLNKRIHTFNQDHPDLPIVISQGFSTASQGESLLDHLKIADQRMYEEKTGKKNGDRIPIFFPLNDQTKKP